MSTAPGTSGTNPGGMGDFLKVFGPLLSGLGNIAPGTRPQQQAPQVIVTERRESDNTGLFFIGILLTVVLIAIFKK